MVGMSGTTNSMVNAIKNSQQKVFGPIINEEKSKVIPRVMSAIQSASTSEKVNVSVAFLLSLKDDQLSQEFQDHFFRLENKLVSDTLKWTQDFTRRAFDSFTHAARKNIWRLLVTIVKSNPCGEIYSSFILSILSHIDTGVITQLNVDILLNCIEHAVSFSTQWKNTAHVVLLILKTVRVLQDSRVINLDNVNTNEDRQAVGRLRYFLSNTKSFSNVYRENVSYVMSIMSGDLFRVLYDPSTLLMLKHQFAFLYVPVTNVDIPFNFYDYSKVTIHMVSYSSHTVLNETFINQKREKLLQLVFQRDTCLVNIDLMTSDYIRFLMSINLPQGQTVESRSAFIGDLLFYLSSQRINIRASLSACTADLFYTNVSQLQKQRVQIHADKFIYCKTFFDLLQNPRLIPALLSSVESRLSLEDEKRFHHIQESIVNVVKEAERQRFIQSFRQIVTKFSSSAMPLTNLLRICDQIDRLPLPPVLASYSNNPVSLLSDEGQSVLDAASSLASRIPPGSHKLLELVSLFSSVHPDELIYLFEALPLSASSVFVNQYKRYSVPFLVFCLTNNKDFNNKDFNNKDFIMKDFDKDSLESAAVELVQSDTWKDVWKDVCKVYGHSARVLKEVVIKRRVDELVDVSEMFSLDAVKEASLDSGEGIVYFLRETVVTPPSILSFGEFMVSKWKSMPEYVKKWYSETLVMQGSACREVTDILNRIKGMNEEGFLYATDVIKKIARSEGTPAVHV